MASRRVRSGPLSFHRHFRRKMSKRLAPMFHSVGPGNRRKFLLASVVARATNVLALFFPTLGAGFVLVVVYRLFGAGASYSHCFGILIKGKPVVLLQNGKLQHKNMRLNHIPKRDLEEDMRPDA